MKPLEPIAATLADTRELAEKLVQASESTAHVVRELQSTKNQTAKIAERPRAVSDADIEGRNK
jgi:hypothetical protein